MSSSPRTVGPWQLYEELGSGGNATVFRATGPDGRQVALKLLRSTRVDREPYQRFVREVAVLRSLDDMDGILPVLDAYLPEAPSKSDEPWLAMPVATPLAEALSDGSLEQVVQATARIARTLARLHGQGIAHRDIKPGNLYELQGDWLVGDFGLVAGPDTRGLTAGDRPLGPRHYMPYEMMTEPQSADPKPADVYSLAKTLWVLATAQRYPPEGHQVSGTRGFGIGDWRPHPNAYLLDGLIDRATRIRGAERPSMGEIAMDLKRWAALPPPEVRVDLGHIRSQLRAKMEAELDAEDIAHQRKDLALAAIRRLTELAAPLNQALRDLHPRAIIDGQPDKFTRNIVRTHDETFGSPEIVFRWQRLSKISSGESVSALSLAFARTVELTSDGLFVLHLATWVGYERLNGLPYRWLPGPWSAPVGSVEADELMRTSIAEAATRLTEAAAAFVEALP